MCVDEVLPAQPRLLVFAAPHPLSHAFQRRLGKADLIVLEVRAALVQTHRPPLLAATTITTINTAASTIRCSVARGVVVVVVVVVVLGAPGRAHRGGAPLGGALLGPPPRGLRPGRLRGVPQVRIDFALAHEAHPVGRRPARPVRHLALARRARAAHEPTAAAAVVAPREDTERGRAVLAVLVCVGCPRVAGPDRGRHGGQGPHSERMCVRKLVLTCRTIVVVLTTNAHVGGKMERVSCNRGPRATV